MLDYATGGLKKCEIKNIDAPQKVMFACERKALWQGREASPHSRSDTLIQGCNFGGMSKRMCSPAGSIADRDWRRRGFNDEGGIRRQVTNGPFDLRFSQAMQYY